MDAPAANPDGGPQHPADTVRKLNLKVTDESYEVLFAVKGSTKLGKVMEKYAANQGKDLATMRFLFDGLRIRPENTPDDVSPTAQTPYVH